MVIVIVGILAAFSVAQFNNYQERARFAKAQAFASQVKTKMLATLEDLKGRYDFEDASTKGKFLNLANQSQPLTFNNYFAPTVESFDGSRALAKSRQDSLGFMQTNQTLTAPYSISFWYNPELVPDWDQLLGLGNASLGGHSTDRIFYRVDGNYYWFDDTKIQANHWHHILFIHEGFQVTLYLDGNRQETLALDPAHQMTNANTVTPSLIYLNQENDSSFIDEVYITNTKLEF